MDTPDTTLEVQPDTLAVAGDVPECPEEPAAEIPADPVEPLIRALDALPVEGGARREAMARLLNAWQYDYLAEFESHDYEVRKFAENPDLLLQHYRNLCARRACAKIPEKNAM
ncbi:MAG: hypothetical protein PHS73_03600 [Candidatus Peribacteraceae bacterium]|nr:hypothetical protein [Candidatus Peribacteraceae bacterium]